MVKTTQNSDLTQSAIFSVIVYFYYFGVCLNMHCVSTAHQIENAQSTIEKWK